MTTRPATVWATIILFLAAVVPGAPLLGGAEQTEETAKLVREADEAYQNGNFKLAIEKYQKAMQLIGEKKELAKTKQELFQTMTSLALTYFTIQENAKARQQLADLIQAAPNHELDPEFYPPKFLEIFRGVQAEFLGSLSVTSTPPGASVSLDGVPLGAAPLSVPKVLKGSHALKAQLPGHEPVEKSIVVQAGAESREALLLEAKAPVIEKSRPPAQAKAKKKKLSPLIIVGGVAAAAVVAAVLLSGKKSEDKKELRVFDVAHSEPVPIDIVLPTYVPLTVQGIPSKVERIEYRVVISHPGHMEDLTINIVGTDSKTLLNIWNRAQATSDPQFIKGSTEAFNSLPGNGTWRLLVQNPGRSPGGRIQEFLLKIYFYE